MTAFVHIACLCQNDVDTMRWQVYLTIVCLLGNCTCLGVLVLLKQSKQSRSTSTPASTAAKCTTLVRSTAQMPIAYLQSIHLGCMVSRPDFAHTNLIRRSWIVTQFAAGRICAKHCPLRRPVSCVAEMTLYQEPTLGVWRCVQSSIVIKSCLSRWEAAQWVLQLC